MTCDFCDHNWVTISQQLIDRRFPIPQYRLDHEPDVALENRQNYIMWLREAHIGSVYPCETCAPVQFEQYQKYRSPFARPSA